MSIFSKNNTQQEAAAAQSGSEENVARVTAPANTNATPAVAVEEYDVIPDDLLRDIARLKGRPAAEKPVPVLVSVLYPVSAAIAADERKKESARKRAEEEALKNPQIGQEITIQGVNQGVFFGQYKILGEIFNAFAAPQDLTDASGNKETYKYVDAVKRIAALKNWNGHDGTSYETDKDLHKALKDKTYNGGWFIPTRELLVGTDVNGSTNVQKDNLYTHKDKGALKGTFTTAAASGSVYPDWYWSSTEGRDDSSGVHIVRFSDGNEGWPRKDGGRLSCRPVRLVPAVAL